MTNAPGNAPTGKPRRGGGLFAALRRPKWLVGASDADLDAIISSGQRLAEFSCILVVAALAAGAVFAAFPFLIPRDRITGFAVNAIIAGGVCGVLIFHGRCADAQNEKLRQASARLTQMEFEFGCAQERAAELAAKAAESEKQAYELGLKAAEAELKLQRLSKPRVPDQGKFLKALAGKPKPSKIDVLYSMDGADCSTLAAWTAKFLRDAGWPIDPEYPLVIPRSADPNLSSAQTEGGQPWGITILDPDPEKGGQPAHALLDALFESVGSPLLAAVKTEKIPQGSLRIVVAPRP